MQHVAGAPVVFPHAQHVPATLDCLGLAGVIACAAVQRLRASIGNVSFSGAVEQQRQVGTRELDAREQARIIALACHGCRPTQLAHRTLKVAGRGARDCQIAEHARGLIRRAGDLVDSQRRRERGDRSREVASSGAQQPDVVPHLGGTDAFLGTEVQGQRFMVTLIG